MTSKPPEQRESIAGETTDPRRTQPIASDAPDIVQETSEEFFPASDAPSWTPVTAIGPPN